MRAHPQARIPVAGRPTVPSDAGSDRCPRANRLAPVVVDTAMIPPTAVVNLFCFLLPPVAVLSSNAVVPLLTLFGLVAGLRGWWESGHLPWPDRTIGIAIVALLLWMAVASLWTSDVARALVLVVRLGVLLLAGLVLLKFIWWRTTEERLKAARWLLYGFGLGVAIFLIEHFLDFPIYRFLTGIDPSEPVNLSRLNRAATSLAMLTWPLAATTFLNPNRPWSRAASLAVAPVVLVTESATAQIAILVGCLFVCVARLHFVLARRLLLVATLLGISVAPLIAHELYEQGVTDWKILPPSAQHRIYIWNFVSDRIAEREAFGWGFDASRNIPNFGVPDFWENGGDVVPLHPHNAALQVWLELGAAGTVIVLAVLVLLWIRMDALPDPARIAAHGLYVTTLSAAMTGYGIWQSQWIAAILAVAALIPLGVGEVPTTAARRN